MRRSILLLLLLFGATSLDPRASSANAQSCRPAVLVNTDITEVDSGNPSTVRVTLRANASVPGGDRLTRVTITGVTNAVLDVGGPTPGLPWVLDLDPPTPTWSFIIRRRATGPFQAVFTARDLCGDVAKFAGHGGGMSQVPSQPLPTSTATATPTQTPSTAPTPPPASEASPILVDSYRFAERDGDAGAYGDTVYRPRQVTAGLTIPDPSWGDFVVADPGPYAGWDILRTPNRDEWRLAVDQSWVRVRLNRSATVGIVWRGPNSPPPAWLAQQGWAEMGTMRTTNRANGHQAGTHRVFRKLVPAGDLDIPGVGYNGDGRANNTWWILLAESDGRPSAAPAVPSGREAPRPNETCPSWVHDQSVTVGPDGRTYSSWHRAVDPVYWCYYRHEHGDDPSLLGVTGFMPPYHYAATADNASEPHPGFKGMSWMDESTGARWHAIIHFGSGNTNSVCNRFHEVQFAASRDGQLLFHVQLQADFGMAQANNTNDVVVPVIRPNCPDGSPAPGSIGHRQMPIQRSLPGDPTAGNNPVFYEPWRLDFRTPSTVLGVNMAAFVVNNPDPQTICQDRNCADPPVVTGKPGAQRFWDWQPEAHVRAPANLGPDGVFWTDAKANRVVTAGTPGAVRQFVQAGLDLPVWNLSLHHCAAVTPWGTDLSPCRQRAGHGVVRNPERSITGPN